MYFRIVLRNTDQTWAALHQLKALSSLIKVKPLSNECVDSDLIRLHVLLNFDAHYYNFPMWGALD